MSSLEKKSKKELLAEIAALQQALHDKNDQESEENQRMLHALEQSNAVLQDLFDNSHDFIFICSIEGKFLFVNKAFKNKLGYSTQELEQLNFKDLIHPDYKGFTFEQINNIIQEESNYQFETLLITQRGEKIHLQGRLTCRYENNIPIALRGICYDSTEKVRAEKAQNLYYSIANLTIQSDNLEMLYANIHRELGKVIEVDNFYIALYNQASQLLEYPYYIDEKREGETKDRKRKVGKGLAEYTMFTHKKAIFLYEENIRSLMAYEDVEIFGTMPKIWLGVPLKFEDGVTGLIAVKSYNSRSTFNKRDLELLDFISGQIALAIQRKQNEETFRNIFDSFQDIYYQSDLKGFIQMVSPSVYTLGNYEPKDIIGKHIAGFYTIDPKSTAALKSYPSIFKELFKHGKIKNFEVGLKKKNGDIVPSISNMRLVYNMKGDPIAVEGVVRDITELKKASEEVIKAKDVAERSLKAKETFLANMSHEIRTPMNGIIGLIELLHETSLNEKQKSYVATIKKSSEILLNILDDILTLSKIEAGKKQLYPKPLHLRKMLEKIYILFSQQAQVKNNILTYSLADTLPNYILADETRLLQIISNLTSNAIKFTKNGSIKIVISSVKVLKDKLHIKIEVQDTGIGITEEDKNLLFKNFSQLDNSFSKIHTGTGLGLAISKELCKLMGGKIGVTSQKDKGSTFWFTFQTKALQNADENIPLQEDKIEKIPFTKIPHILVVDDNQVNRMVARETLKKIGCHVIVATSALEAIQKVKKQAFDLIFMDIQMPDMDGIEATKKIKHLKLIKMPPIIAMTAYSMPEDKAKFLEQGLDDYIAKPIKVQQLIAKVKYYLLAMQATEISNTNLQELNLYNPTIFEQLKNLGGESLLLEALEEFEKETILQIKACKKAITNENHEIIQQNLHTLKGTAGTLGFELLADKAKIVEEIIREKQNKKLKAAFKALEESWQATQGFIKSYVD